MSWYLNVKNRKGEAQNSGTLFQHSTDTVGEKLKKGEARHRGQLFNTHPTDKVKIEKWPAVSLI